MIKKGIEVTYKFFGDNSHYYGTIVWIGDSSIYKYRKIYGIKRKDSYFIDHAYREDFIPLKDLERYRR